MRTDQEIIQRIEEVKADDFFGTQVGDLVMYLSWTEAKGFFKEDSDTYKSDGATYDQTSREPLDIVAQILDYMPFAWDKANDCLGLSASRSMDHMRTWLWMLDRADLLELCDRYTEYGKPQLQTICEAFGWDYKQWDNGYRGTSEDNQRKAK